jgi:hypothetical protein
LLDEAVLSVITVSVDLWSLFGPARNQRSRPTCLAFAASDAHAALRSGWMPLSCEYAFYQAQRRAGRPPSRDAVILDVGRAASGRSAIRKRVALLGHHAGRCGVMGAPGRDGPLFGRDSEKFNPSLDRVTQELAHGRPVTFF